MNLEDEFGDIIKKARRGHGLTAAQLAGTTVLSERDIESIEAYRHKPEMAGIEALAQALSLDAKKLAGIAAEAWSPSPAAFPSNPVIDIVPVSWGGYWEKSYILGCANSHKAAVVDPGGAAEEINKRLADLGLTLDLVLITHAHGDHIGGLGDLLAKRPSVRLAAHPLEREPVNRGLLVAWESADDGAVIHLGSLAITALHTPGHTPGSTCFQTSRVCFTGDTLFAGSIGGPIGPEVYSQMLADIHAKLLSLPDDTILLPGHGPPTTVGEEKAHNPFF